ISHPLDKQFISKIKNLTTYNINIEDFEQVKQVLEQHMNVEELFKLPEIDNDILRMN
ncbi:MAG: hypothetical protein MHPSP_001644, partial [Paramarteilia canceri]